MYDVTQLLGKDVHLWIWPAVVTGADKIDPLRDGRLTNVLREQDMEHCCIVPWSLGQGGEEEHILMQPWGMATNSSRHFIIADYEDRDVKVLDCNGILRNQFSPPNDYRRSKFYVHDVATDMYDNIYALFVKRKTGNCGFEGEGVICVFNTAGLHCKFPMRKGEWYRLLVNDSHKVLVLGDEPGDWRVIDVYEADGQFVRRIGEGLISAAKDITGASNGRVFVIDAYVKGFVHIFSDYGDFLGVFQLREECTFSYITFHWKSEHIIVVGKEPEKDRLCVLIHTKDGEFVRSAHIREDDFAYFTTGVTVTIEGHIAVALQHLFEQGKVLVL